jgi:hypothetical protein
MYQRAAELFDTVYRDITQPKTAKDGIRGLAAELRRPGSQPTGSSR